MSAAANTVSDSDNRSDDSGSRCFFEIFISGKHAIGVILVPRNDISFKSIRNEIMEDETPVPKPFRFTLGADGKAFPGNRRITGGTGVSSQSREKMALSKIHTRFLLRRRVGDIS